MEHFSVSSSQIKKSRLFQRDSEKSLPEFGFGMVACQGMIMMIFTDEWTDILTVVPVRRPLIETSTPFEWELWTLLGLRHLYYWWAFRDRTSKTPPHSLCISIFNWFIFTPKRDHLGDGTLEHKLDTIEVPNEAHLFLGSIWIIRQTNHPKVLDHWRPVKPLTLEYPKKNYIQKARAGQRISLPWMPYLSGLSSSTGLYLRQACMSNCTINLDTYAERLLTIKTIVLTRLPTILPLSSLELPLELYFPPVSPPSPL